MHIRELTTDDIDAAIALWERTSGVGPVRRPELERLCSVAPELVLVAEIDGVLVGTVLGSDDGRRGWIFRLAVDETYRGRGIGRALVAEIEQRLLARGLDGVRLLVLPENAAGRAFWASLGYSGGDLMAMYGRDLRDAGGSPVPVAGEGLC